MNKGLFGRVALFGALLGGATQPAAAAVVQLSAATTISATTDVSNAGSAKYAYCWSLGNRTVNGTTFIGTTLNNGTVSGNVTLASFGQQNSTAFNSATAPFGALDAGYRGALTGAVYGAVNTTGTVTLLNLTAGRQYQVQVWASDPRAGATTGRTQVATSPGGNSQLMKYNAAAAAGSPGQLVTGTFIADGASQLLRIVGVGGFVGGTNLPQVNALAVRELAGGSYWNGLQDGTLGGAGTNFQGGLTLAQVTATVATVFFADADLLGTAVANTNLTVAAGGVVITNLIFQNVAKSYTLTSADATGLTGDSSLRLRGSGRVVLAGPNTFTGNVILTNGVLGLRHSDALGSSAKTLQVTASAGAGGVELEGGVTIPAAITWLTSNQGAPTSAIHSVSGSNVIGGAIQMTSGGGNTRVVVDAGSELRLAGLVTNVTAVNRTLELGGAGLGVVQGSIHDGTNAALSGVQKDGAGTWTLAGTNTYVGGTLVNAGTLALGADATLLSRIITLSGAAVFDVTAQAPFGLAGDQTLQGVGLVTGAVAAADGARLVPGGAGVAGALVFGGGLALSAGTTNVLDLGAGSNDQIQVVGDLEPGNAVVRVNPLEPPVSGTYPIFTYSGAKGTTFDPTVQHPLASRLALSLDETGAVGVVKLVVAAGAPAALAWNPAVSADWDLAASNWVDVATRTVTDRFYEADTVLFDDAGAASNVINLAGVVRPALITVDAGSNYTFAGAGRISNPLLGVTTRLVKAGSGRLDVLTTNDFTGGTTVSNGTLAVATAGALGPGPVTMDGGALESAGASQTVANAVAVNGAAVGLNDGGGVLTLTGGLRGPGGMVKTGAGQVNLQPASPNSYTGGTVVQEGTLRLGFGNTTLNLGTIQGELTIQTGAVVLAATDKALGFASSPSGNVTVVRINEGLLDFRGVNGMGAGQTVFMRGGEIRSNGGTNSPAAGGFYRVLPVGADPTLYTLSSAAAALMTGRVQLDSNGVFNTEDGPAAPDLQVDASLTGGGILFKQGPGRLLLTGTNTFTGQTLIQTGTLALGASATLSSSPVVRLSTGATFDVTALPAWVMNANQALVGGGTVAGDVIARTGSVIRAGGLGPVETLTFAGNLGLHSGAQVGFDLTDVPAVGGGTNDLVVVTGRLEPSNSVVVVNQLKPLGTGSYTLATHDGTKTTFFNPAVQGNGSRQSWTLDESTVPTVVALVVTGSYESLVWRPQASAAWDLASSNWFVTSQSTTDRFYQFDTVLFDNSGAYSNVVTLSGALNPQAVAVNASSNYTLTGPGSIGGTNGLLKQGAGTLVLNSTNTYTGGTRVQGGTLSIAVDGNLGSTAVSNSVTLDGGALELTANLTPPANRKLVIGAGGGTLTGTGTAGLAAAPEDTLKGSGPLLITGNSATHTVLQPAGAQSNFSGAITIAGGRINLPNAAGSLGSGEVTVGAGTASLYLTTSNSLPNVINIQSDGGENRGAVRFQGGGTLTGPLVLLSNASVGVEAGVASLQGPVTGAFVLTLGPASSANTGLYHLLASNSHAGTTVRKGTLGLTNDNALGAVGAPLVLSSAAAGTLLALGDGVVLPASRPVALGGTASSTFDTAGFNLAVNAAITGTGALQKAGSGTLTFGGANSYTGATVVQNGTLVVGAAGALPVGTALTLGSGTNVAHLDMAGFSAQVGGLTVGPNAVAPNTITINAGQALTVAGNVSIGNNSGANTRTVLAVSGAGALVVSGATYQVGAATGAVNYDGVTNDLSQLGAFAAYLGAAGTLRVGNIASSSPGVTPFGTALLLASNSTISAGTLGVGDATGQGVNSASLVLGAGSNVLNAGLINIGLQVATGGRSSGRVLFQQAAGSLVLRGATGGTSRATVNLVNHANTTATDINGLLDVRGHAADLLLGPVVIGSRTANSAQSDTGLLAFDTGVLDATSVVIGRRQSTSGTSLGTLDVGGGAVTLGAVTLADSLTAGGTANGTLTVTGGVVTLLGNIRKGASVGSGAATANLGGGTLRAGADFTNESAVALVLSGSPGPGVLDASTNTLVVAGPISGPGGLTKIGAGDLVLSGASSFGGALTLSNGVTYFNGTGTLPGGVTVATAAVLRGSGLLTGAATVEAGGLLKPGLAAGPAALTVNTLTLAEDAVLQVFAGGTGALVRVAANNGFSATPVGFNYVDVLDAALATGAYPVVDYDGSIQDGDLTAFQLRDVPPRMGLTLVENVGNSSLDLVVSSTNEPIRWTGAASALWNINTTTNWKTAAGGTPTAYLQPFTIGDAVIFDDSAVGNFAVTVATPVQPVSLSVSNSVNNFTFAGSPIGGATGLDKDGAARLTLASSNAFTGVTRVRAGTLALGSAQSLGAVPMLLAPSQLVVEAGATLEALGDLALPAERGVVIGTPAAGGTVTIATGTNTVTIPGGLAAHGTATSGLAKTGSGLLTLGAVNTYAGGTAVQGGTLAVGGGANPLSTNAPVTVAAGATLDLGGQSQTLAGGLTGTGVVTSAAGTLTLAVAAGATNRFDGVLAGGLALVKADGGVLELTGASTLAGAVALRGGRLSLRGGDNRLPAAAQVNFDLPSALALVAMNQAVSNIAFAAVAMTNTITGLGLTVNGDADLTIGPVSGAPIQFLDLSGLGAFTFAAPTRAMRVGPAAAATANANGQLTLAETNSITAAFIGVGEQGLNGNGPGTNTLRLGQVSSLNADTVIVGSRQAAASVHFRSGLVAPSLVLRGTAGGTNPVGTMVVGSLNHFTSLALPATVDTSAGSLDARVGSLVIGQIIARYGNSSGLMLMNAGTLVATNLILGQNLSSTNASGIAANGTFVLNGGTVTVDTLTLSDNVRTNNGIARGTFALSNGLLQAAVILKGRALGTNVAALSWAGGTIANRDAATDLVISNGVAIDLTSGGMHVLSADAGRAVTVYASMTGTAGLVKQGLGTAVLGATNTYAGATIISNGALWVNGLVTGPITVDAAGVLGGTGVVRGVVTQDGVVAPGAGIGTLTVSNQLNATATAVYRFELGGTNAPTDYDQLVVSDVHTLQGALEVIVTNGYVPASGDRFVILTNSGVGGLLFGTFTTVSAPVLPAGLGWEVQYTATESASLVVTGTLGAVLTPYELWAQSITNPALRGEREDADGDGYANLLEYSQGTDATNGADNAKLSLVRSNGQFLVLFNRVNSATDIVYEVEGAYLPTNNATWLGIATNVVGNWGSSTNVNDNNTAAVHRVLVTDLLLGTNRSLRLKVTRP